MSRRVPWSIGAWMLFAAVASMPPACGDKKGGLMLAVTTDMKAPKDVSILSLTIKSGTQIKHNILARVRPNGDVELPATIAIAEPDDPSATIRVRVIAFQERKPRVLRDVRTTIPRGGRTALLRLGLNFVNDGSGTGDIPVELMPGAIGGSDAEFDPYSSVVSKCDIDLTVIDGECQSDYVDPETLPDFEESLVFGEGGKEACFQSGICFAGANPVAITPPASGGCSFPIGARVTSDLNLALSTRDTGECLADGRCLVPIDQGDSGWRINGANIELSPGTCSKLREGSQLLEGHAGGCKPKTASQPLCEGGGTSTGDAGPDGDASAPGAEKMMPENFATGVAMLGNDLYMVSAQGLSVLKPGMPGQNIAGVAQGPGPRFITRAGGGIAIANGSPKPGTPPRGGGYVLASPGGALAQLDFPDQVDLPNSVTFLGLPQANYLWAVKAPAAGTGLFTSGPTGLPSPAFPAINSNLTSVFAFSPTEFLIASDAGVIALCRFNGGEMTCDAPRPTANAARIDALIVNPLQPQTALYLQADAVWTAVLSGPSIVATKLAPNSPVQPLDSGGNAYPHGLAIGGPCAFFTTNTNVEWVRLGDPGVRGLVAKAGAGTPLGLDVGPGENGMPYVFWAVFADLNGGGGAFRAPVPAECLK